LISVSKWSLPCHLKWDSDMCEVNELKATKLGFMEYWYNGSNVYVVGYRSYMEATMVEIIFLISEGRCNQELIPREKE
jgi:hypothetical protein